MDQHREVYNNTKHAHREKPRYRILWWKLRGEDKPNILTLNIEAMLIAHIVFRDKLEEEIYYYNN